MFYGLWKFSLLNYQSILWPSTIPGKEGQKRKVGEAAWSVKASGWKPDLQSSWGMVEFASLPKQESDCPFQECWRLWNWKPRGNSCSHLRGTGMSCLRWCTKHGSSVLGEGGQGLLWALAPTTGSSSAGWWSWRAGKQAWWLQITTVSVRLAQTNETEGPGFFVSLTELLSTEEEKAIYRPSFFLKQPQQTIPKGIISSWPLWTGLRLQRPAEPLDPPVANVMVVEKWTKLYLSISHYLGNLLPFLCLPSPFPCLSWLLQWQRKTPSSRVCTESSTIRLPSSPLTNTTESNNQRTNSSKTSPDPSSSSALHWEFST